MFFLSAVLQTVWFNFADQVIRSSKPGYPKRESVIFQTNDQQFTDTDHNSYVNFPWDYTTMYLLEKSRCF